MCGKNYLKDNKQYPPWYKNIWNRLSGNKYLSIYSYQMEAIDDIDLYCMYGELWSSSVEAASMCSH